MQAIRKNDTKPELLIRKALHALGYHYRLGGSGLSRGLDMVLPKYKTAMFIHDLFWHDHNCKYSKCLLHAPR